MHLLPAGLITQTYGDGVYLTYTQAHDGAGASGNTLMLTPSEAMTGMQGMQGMQGVGGMQNVQGMQQMQGMASMQQMQNVQGMQSMQGSGLGMGVASFPSMSMGGAAKLLAPAAPGQSGGSDINHTNNRHGPSAASDLIAAAAGTTQGAAANVPLALGGTDSAAGGTHGSQLMMDANGQLFAYTNHDT